MIALTILLLALGAAGTVFFSGMRASLSVCNRLILEIDVKNGSARQGVVFRPGDNIELCVTLMHTGEIVSECLLAAGLAWAVSQWGPPEPWKKASLMAASAMAALVIAKTLPSALLARRSNAAIRRLSPMASAMANLIYPWLYIVMFPIVAMASRRGENKFFELTPFCGPGGRPGCRDFRPQHFKILKNALDFTNIKIRECLVPRNEIVFAYRNDSIETLARKFTESNFSKILICDKSIDQVSGYVNALSLFRNPMSIDKILTSVIEVPETMTAGQLFKLFIKRRLSVAIVIDEFGGTAGMLTIEDIIEEITGEIEDEHDSQELAERQISASEYELAGRLEIDYINDKYKIGLPKTDEYETLAGYILMLNEDFPSAGDVVHDGRFSLRILNAEGTKINLVRLSVAEDEIKLKS